ncbi:MAG: uroporphyrinogen-III C-methyltransferase [Hyphomicrobiales bacterium]|nr:uroporphyrinogen-III C-methyltransferase [Hyphomicrobiales bacterium]
MSAPPTNLVAPKEEAPEARTARRIDVLSSLPIFLKLAGRRAVIVGATEAALWKAELVAACDAKVEVFAGIESARFRALAADPPAGAVHVHERDWQESDLLGAAIAIADLQTDEEAARFAEAARLAGVPFNVVDKPSFCDLQFGAIVNRSPLLVSISTDGAAPVFAQAIRAKIEALLPQGLRRWARAARDWRPALARLGIGFTERRAFWERFSDRALAEPGLEPHPELRDSLLETAARSAHRGAPKGRVTLVGAGPGDPDLLTLKAVRALQSAEVILYDQLVSDEVLDFARREAKRIMVGKTGHGPSCKQAEINELMLRLARQGKHVVRLKGGDPLIFGRASEEIEACRRAGIEVAIVPGITAAQGAAASLGISLTQRERARRLQFITGHAKDGKLPPDIDWAALADPSVTTALYMPKRTLAEFCAKAIEKGLLPTTPAVAISRATRPDERKVFGTVSELPELIQRLDAGGPLLVLIGRGLDAIGTTSSSASSFSRLQEKVPLALASGG